MNEMVLNTSDEAATFKTVSGWVDRHGHFFGNDERLARWSGATHTPCEECGEPVSKGYVRCPNCREKMDKEKFLAMPMKKWDGETPLYSRHVEEFFFDEESLRDYCEEELRHTIEEMELIICEPKYAHPLESDYWEDSLPEDCEVPESLEEAIKAFNESIKDLPPLSWIPGKYRAIVHISE